MKAQEYFDKYFAERPKTVEEFEFNARKMFREFMEEAEELQNKRKVTTDSGIVGIVRELNEKWNSVSNKIEKKYGKQLIKRNVIWNILLAEKIPEFERKGD